MNTQCALCGTPLTSMDTLLGENKLSDGGSLCNACLDKLSSTHQELLYNLHSFSISDIKNLKVGNTAPEAALSREEENEVKSLSTFSNPDEMPHDLYKKRLKEIKYQLAQVGANLSMFTKGEIKELPRILAVDEVILAATDAQFLKTVDAGMLLVTPKRMISVSKAMFSPVKVNEYLNENITAVSYVDHQLSPIIKIHTEGKTVDFECFFDRLDAERFYGFIQKIYNQEEAQKKVQEAKEATSDLILDQLEKLGKLRENGILTHEEFTEQKKKLLDQLS